MPDFISFKSNFDLKNNEIINIRKASSHLFEAEFTLHYVDKIT